MTEFLSLIFAVILISIIAIPQALQAFFRLIYGNRRNRKDIRGKLAIVNGTEADNELMKLIAEKLVRLGCNVVLICNDFEENKLKTSENLQLDATVKCLRLETGDAEEINNIYRNLVKEHKNIDILINVPKLVDPEQIKKLSQTKISSRLNDKFKNVMLTTISMIDVMKCQKEAGQIVTLSPITGLSVIPENYPTYSAYFGFMKSVNKYVQSSELNGKIKTSLVMPCCIRNGTFLSQFLSRYFNFKPLSAEFIADTVVERMLEDEEIIELPSNLMNFRRILKYFECKIFEQRL